MIKWNYESSAKTITGYEDVADVLSQYTHEVYRNASEEDVVENLWSEESGIIKHGIRYYG